MPTIIEASDLHLNPTGDLTPETYTLARIAKASSSRVVLNGDVLNLLPWGLKKWRTNAGKETIDRLAAVFGDGFDYVSGNHDPYPWVKDLFKGYPHVRVSRRLDLPTTNHFDVHFRHGDSWSADWWLLYHLAPTFVEFMADHFPRAWFWFCKWVGWIPSRLKALGETKRYDVAVGIVWSNALRYAEENGVRVVVGHTHASGQIRRYVGQNVETLVADGGDLLERTYLTICADIELSLLP